MVDPETDICRSHPASAAGFTFNWPELSQLQLLICRTYIPLGQVVILSRSQCISRPIGLMEAITCLLCYALCAFGHRGFEQTDRYAIVINV
jgi:hypothetical protein